jgi:hypothetical protein
VFRAECESPSEPDEEKKGRALLSFSLLTRFETLPGRREGSIDNLALRKWIDEVRKIGAETDRAKISDNLVGRLLAHAPVDEDGGWPHRVIRDEIERLRSEEVEDGIQIERFNMRGVHWKALNDGGNQERALAGFYSKSAAASGAWSRTATMLRNIARDWEMHAQQADVEAAQRKLRG